MMRTAARSSLLKNLLLALTVLLTASVCRAQSATASIQAMKLVSGRSGWLLANSRLFWTDSVGAQWAEITPAQKGAPFVASAFFSPQGKGWALLASTDGVTLKLAQTIDKGQHWSYAPIASPFTAAAVFNGHADTDFVDDQHGWIMLGLQSSSAFRRGILLTTTDGGLHWNKAPMPPVGGDLYFTDATHGWTGPGPNGDELFSTADAGQTWQAAKLLPPSAEFQQVHSTIALPVFTDASNGSLLRTYIGDSGTSIVRYATTDGGATWHANAALLANTFAALAADGSLVSRSTAAAKAGLPTNPAVGELIAVRSSFGTTSAGLVLFAGGQCVASTGLCTQSRSLKGTLDGGQTFFSVAPVSGIELESTTQTPGPGTNRNTPVSQGHGATPNSSYPIVDVMGFDACTLPTASQMQTFYTSSPYRTVGVYIGGDEFACSSGLSALTPTYVSTVLGQGWEIMPIWVGPQAPGAGFNYSISTDPTTATAQGVAEADSAAAEMNALGMGQGSTVIYDMEAYTYTNATYAAATTAFIQGWDSELHAQGYLASVYSGHYEFGNWIPPMLTPAIDTIWFTYYFSTGVSCGSTCDTVYPTQSALAPIAAYWLNHHRSRQTSSAFNSTYGGVTLNLDEDYTDAAFEVATPIVLTVAKAGTGKGTVATATINNSLDTSIDTAISCGPTCTTASANFAPTDTVTLTATPATGSSFASWTGCTSVSGSTCTITTTAASTVTANFASTATYALTVVKAGAGTGTVVSSDGNISCGNTCSASYTTGSTVTLTATSAAGSSFASWTGCTSVSGATCTVTTTATAATVTANFASTATYALTVVKTGAGTGTVVSSDGNISCGSTCSAAYATGSTVTLTATAATGSAFANWTGCTSVSGATCTVTTTTAASTVTVNFSTAATYALTVVKTGSGTVVSSDGYINCGSTCSAAYTTGSAVTLTATAAAGYTFSSWTGCTLVSGSTCTVTTTTAASTVTANFVSIPTYALTVVKTGSGTVVSSDGYISCGSTCSASYAAANTVTLTATPATGYSFGGWAGCTTSSGAMCSVTTGNAPETVTATFTVAPTFTAALSATTLSIIGGNSATDTLTISPQTGYTGTFTAFSCTGLPSSATCAFSPTSLTATGNGASLTSTLTITTTPVASASVHWPSLQASSGIALAGLFFPAVLLPWVLRRKRIHIRGLSLLLFAGLAFSLSQLTGCGGSSASNSTGASNPPFSGTINVTFTSATGVNSLPIQLSITSK